MRSERVPLRRLGVVSNRPLVGAVALTTALQTQLVTVEPVRSLLGLRSLQPAHWLLVVAIALTYLVLLELDKALRHRRGRRCDPALPSPSEV